MLKHLVKDIPYSIVSIVISLKENSEYFLDDTNTVIFKAHKIVT